MGQYGIQETLDVIDAGIAVSQVVSGAMADGKIDLADIALVIPMLPKLGAAAANVGMVPKELGELDAAEAAQIVAHVAAVVGQSKAEQVAVKALKVGLAVIDLVGEFKSAPAA